MPIQPVIDFVGDKARTEIIQNAPRTVENLVAITAGVLSLLGITTAYRRVQAGPPKPPITIWNWTGTHYDNIWLGKGGKNRYRVYSLYPFYRKLKYFKN